MKVCRNAYVFRLQLNRVLKISVRSAGSEFQIVGAAWQNAKTAENSPGCPQHREADNGRWSGDDVMTFGIAVGRIRRPTCR